MILHENFESFQHKNFTVSETKPDHAEVIIGQHANVRGQERFPGFTADDWTAILTKVVDVYGDVMLAAKDDPKNVPKGMVGYKSFAFKFTRKGVQGWISCRIRRHSNTPQHVHNLMVITILTVAMKPQKEDIQKKLPASAADYILSINPLHSKKPSMTESFEGWMRRNRL